ncbi:MAG: ATP-dependent Clp protease ATP-binding subunit [Oscillospiraceae bacterium]|nr:ATP-dependent Clp protease ATP-binding subunit [Ruminococcus sp.]MDD7338636.1 ATP-dependent Clp protease ATP-binding subunit [Ruminococcus sp.]MDY6060433.1 ATP-dependent Clp protease ATP-binding subunit [Oscillospiraceae bacterium]
MKQVLCSKCKMRPAVIFMTKMDGDKQSDSEGLCLKCAMESTGPIKQMMENMGITEDDVDEMSEQFGAMMGMGDDGEGFEPGGIPTFPFLQGMMGKKDAAEEDAVAETEAASENDSKDKKGKNPKEKGAKNNKKRKFLPLYCTNLTQRAREGKIDRIIGRDNEIYRTIQILCRRSKNNPCLIGEPGVGKTAIAEGLAIKIAKGEVPAKLADKEIHLLDLTSLVAGTQFRGQFEGRVKGLVEEVKADGNIILFIDEVHNLVGTGGDADGSMNAANILKPALSRGEVQIIGATTFNEYRKYIEKDAALERRMQSVKVEEPSIEDTCEMLKGIKDYYENYHRVKISDSLIYKAVTLSERFINDRFLPDKAIDLLDEACTCANLRNKNISEQELIEKKIAELKVRQQSLMEDAEIIDYEAIAKVKSDIIQAQAKCDELEELVKDAAVTEDDLARVIQLWTGIPAQKIVESDLRRLADLDKKLKSKVIGQDKAVDLVSAAIRRGRVNISPRRRPASFIFVGPTGVGKTELVKQLANELFDTPETLIRLDMSEFMEKHSVSRIIGSPPGYVGYDEAGQLTEKVRRKPYSVILFDEIEKAHPDVMNILLQILDEGKITDAQGRTVAFDNTVIVMTSNAGSERADSALGFGKTAADASSEKAMKALREFLRPEFIGRVDEVVVFRPLTQEDFEKIAVLMLSELEEPLRDKDISFSYTDEAVKLIAEKSVGGTRGARDLRNFIRRNVEDKIASMIVDSVDNPIHSVTVDVDNGELSVK